MNRPGLLADPETVPAQDPVPGARFPAEFFHPPLPALGTPLHAMTRSLMLGTALVALSAMAAAQTCVVDAAHGPGTHFTDLPPAIAAVPD